MKESQDELQRFNIKAMAKESIPHEFRALRNPCIKAFNGMVKGLLQPANRMIKDMAVQEARVRVSTLPHDYGALTKSTRFEVKILGEPIKFKLSDRVCYTQCHPEYFHDLVQKLRANIAQMTQLMNHFLKMLHPDLNGGGKVIVVPKNLELMKCKARAKVVPTTEYDAFIQKGYLYVPLPEKKAPRGRPRLTDDERAISLDRRQTRRKTARKVPMAPEILKHFKKMVKVLLPPDADKIQPRNLMMTRSSARRQ